MAWSTTLLLLFLARRGDTSPRVHDGDSWSHNDDESAVDQTSSSANYTYVDEAMLDDVCPLSNKSATSKYGFLTAADCGSAACCTFTPLTHYIVTWQRYEIEPVTVGAEVVVIDTEQGLTSTSTEVITTGIVLTLNGEKTTLNPNLWVKDGTFDGGSDVPTRSTIVTDAYDSSYTIKYPTPYVELEKYLYWYGSIPIVSAGATSCLQQRSNPYSRGAGWSVPSPTFVSTPEMTADPTDPKGLFYILKGNAGGPGQQIPGANFGISSGKGPDIGKLTCGGALATELLESWRPTELVISVYSSCLCDTEHKAPAAPVSTVSFLLTPTTRFARLAPTTTDSPIAGQRISNNAAVETSSPEFNTNTDTARSIPINTVGQPSKGSGEQRHSQASNSISTEASADLLQNTGPLSTRRVETPKVSSPTPSVPSAKPSMPVKDTASASQSASITNAASSRIVSSIEPSVTPSSLSPEGSRVSTPTAQDKIELQDTQTQSDTANPLESARLETPSRSGTSLLLSPIPKGSTDPALSSQRPTTPQGVQNEPITANSQSQQSASFRTASSPEQSGQTPPSSKASVDTAASPQRTTESPSVLAEPVPTSSRSAEASSDTPAAAVVVADGQLSMVSVEPSSQSGPLSQSSERNRDKFSRVSDYRILANYKHRSRYQNIEPD
ncbi:hypothetical protein CKM354_001045300 [Cercospora kikuchii]|uniref:Uncharacterized protein n=1 Tax=Cercospora kikuchii TaxID=84275 RepID=A0A9P3CVB4_9PEZI|nr:uncharacterized protein CKM354_001045300 [Cercospora kikuchii]GIZ47360.1 hypothetical protein CKM354_001045300 [Cercospora kikuchii]